MPGEEKLIPLPLGLELYMDVHVVHTTFGYIVWRRGTGGNAEILYIRSLEKGGGRKLLVNMLAQLKKDPPYGGKGTVFGFCRDGNLEAMGFYDHMGFDLSRVTGVYADGTAVVFSATYQSLLQLHEV